MSSRPNYHLARLLLLAGLAAAAIQASRVSALRQENRYWGALQEERAGLARQNEELPRLREAARQMESLQQAEADLPALRNEVRELREQKVEAGKLEAENQQMRQTLAQRGAVGPATITPVNITLTRTNVAYAGQNTPQAAVQSFLWAMSQGRLDVLRACLAPGPGAAKELAKSDEELRRQFANEPMPDLEIVEVLQDGSDAAAVKVRMANRAEAPQTLPLKRLNGQWKLDLPSP